MTSARRTFLVYGFATTHAALAAEAVLKAADVGVVPVPSPKTLSDLCGVAMRIEPGDAAAAEHVLAAAGIEWRAKAPMEDV